MHIRCDGCDLTEDVDELVHEVEYCTDDNGRTVEIDYLICRDCRRAWDRQYTFAHED